MAKISSISFTLLYLSAVVLGQGTQFITGPCTSDADCASGCCGFNSGKCAGAVVAQERDGGCGFGDSQPNDDAAVALGFTGSAATSPASGADTNGSTATNNSSSTSSNVDDSAAGAESVGNGNGAQFITGECTSDADCASGCCGFNSGKCAGAVIALSRDGGCGFGDSSPNDDAAQAMGFTGGISSSSTGDSTSSSSTTPDTSSSSNSTSNSDSGSTDNGSGSTGGSTGSGSQFITGPCTSDADCASGCCGFNSGKCAGAVVAQERDGGCGFGDGVPNDDAAQAFNNAQRRWAEYDYRGE